MKALPQLSIITVNLNNSVGLEQTIQSVINQSFSDFEFLIIDGGSTDNSKRLLVDYGHKIDYWVSEPDDGIYQAMNKGIKQAKGQYYLFLNSGDWLVNKHVIKQCFEKEQVVDLLIGGCDISKDGKVIHTYKPTQQLSLKSFYKNTIPHQSTFISRNIFEKLGLYDESYQIHGDYEFWIRCIIHYNCTVAAFNQVVTDYNVNGRSSDLANSRQSHEEIGRILQHAFPERVLVDYECWRNDEAEMHILRWIKSKKILYFFIKFFYKIAFQLVTVKKLYQTKNQKKNV